MSRRQTLTNDILFGSTAPAQEERVEASAPAPAAPTHVSTPGTSAAALLAERPGLGAEVLAEPEATVVEDSPALDVASETAGQGGDSTRVARRKPLAAGERRPSGRERHDEKITVYLSAEELDGIDIAQLDLRRRFGIRVDRGRIVREAVAVLLADLDARGESSTVVKRLSGRR
jgi:hypothetical protein